MLNYICKKLVEKRNKEYHKLLKLKWEKAELEKKLADAKKQANI